MTGMDGAFDLRGKVALVTGGANGIGRASAKALASLGAMVVVTDVDHSGAIAVARHLGGRAIDHDVTEEDQWRGVISGIATLEGRLDILVNNAGVILNKPFLSTTLEDLRRVQRVNVESVWIGMQTATPLLSESAKNTSGASIINISSIYGQIAGPMHAAYCASKGAVRMLTKAAAIEFARSGSGIRVNSVHPGPVETDLGLSGVRDAVSLGRLKDVDSGRAAVAAMFPMGRWGQVDDIANAVAFLASDASKFMTGAELTVDGGMSIA